jgi:hypothetical protein
MKKFFAPISRVEVDEDEEEAFLTPITFKHKQQQIRFSLPPKIEEQNSAFEKKQISLATALLSRNLIFDDNLFYRPHCPRKFNNATLDISDIQVDCNALIFALLLTFLL